jgi:hypothetical protein
MSALSVLHSAGGVEFMIPIDLVVIINTGLIAYIIYHFISKKVIPQRSLEFLKQFGLFALAWGVFGTLVGLFSAFDALEKLRDPLPFNIISGGLKVALITILYGLLTYIISLIAYLVFKTIQKNNTAIN